MARSRNSTHVHLPAFLDGLGRVAPEPLRDGIGHNSKALAVLVNEAERERAMPHSGAREEEPGRRGALVLQGEQRGAGHAPIAALLFSLLMM